jgi:orotidine-5'-phosphate decarboxylase
MLLPRSFGRKLFDAFEGKGQLCVGVDAHSSLLEHWGLNDDVNGLDYFANSVIDAAAGLVGIVKPQVSFFERHGSSGFAVLERITHRAKDAGLVVIADAKRGDIGSTMEAYLEAWLGQDAHFYADTLTVSPFLGIETSAALMGQYLENGKGVTVLVATSNPEGASLQTSRSESGETVAADIWGKLEQLNRISAAPGDRIGSFSAVVGATLKFKQFGLKFEQSGVKTPILAPGFGAQGAQLRDIRLIFGEASEQVIASVSRSVLEVGKQGLTEAIKRANDELSQGLG